MTHSIRRIKASIISQLQEFKRDRGSIFLNIVFPLLFVIAIIVSQLMSPSFKFKIGIAEVEKTQKTQSFVQELVTNPGLEVKNLSREQLDAQLSNGDIHAALIINSGKDYLPIQVKLLVGQRYEEFAKMLIDAVLFRLENKDNTTNSEQIYQVENPQEEIQSEFTFTFPGLLALALVQLGLFATAVPLLHARDRGTLRYLSITPLSLTEMIISQLLMRVLVALLQIVLILLAGSVMINLAFEQWLAVMGVSLLGTIMMVSIGYAIAGTSKNLQMGMGIILIANFSMLMAGNIFNQVDGSNAQFIIACFLPVSYLADMFRQVISGNEGVWPVWLDGVALVGWTLLAIFITIFTFKFDMIHNEKKPSISLQQAEAI